MEKEFQGHLIPLYSNSDLIGYYELEDDSGEKTSSQIQDYERFRLWTSEKNLLSDQIFEISNRNSENSSLIKAIARPILLRDN